jgi:hypothetical protein
MASTTARTMNIIAVCPQNDLGGVALNIRPFPYAIELYLKSFLRFRGVSAKRLQNIGHDYKRLLSRASKHGLVLGDLEKEVLNTLDGEIWSRSRYLEIGFHQAPTLNALSTTSIFLRQAVAKVLRDAGQPGGGRIASRIGKTTLIHASRHPGIWHDFSYFC